MWRRIVEELLITAVEKHKVKILWHIKHIVREDNQKQSGTKRLTYCRVGCSLELGYVWLTSPLSLHNFIPKTKMKRTK